jgi:hypothetical protein
MNQQMKCPSITFFLLMALCPLMSFAAPRYQLESGTVLDTVTKLIWQEKAPDESYSWSKAEAYCKQQNTDKLGGYSTGWRLPSISELVTIVDYRMFNPAFDQTAFSGPIGRYWTSTPKQGGSGSAWYVLFSDGYSNWYEVSNNDFVRCVR